MDVRLDEFSSSQFDVKGWLNQQFASLDMDAAFDVSSALAQKTAAIDNTGGSNNKSANRLGTESMTQRLTTQLHFLATNSQQGSDRIKARFRHQAAQIVRDIAALTKLIQHTHQRISELSLQINAQNATTRVVERVVEIGTVRHQLQRSVSALDYLRSYTNLPQKINALLASGDLTQAWELVDSIASATIASDNPGQQQQTEEGMGPSASAAELDPNDINNYKEQIRLAAMEKLSISISNHDAEATTAISKLLALHGYGNKVEPVFVELRAKLGLKKLKTATTEAASNMDNKTIDGLLSLVVDLISQERAFIDATDLQASATSLLEQLLELYFEALQPCITAKIAELQYASSNPDSDDSAGDMTDVAPVIDFYQMLVSYYSEVAEMLNSSNLSVGNSSSNSNDILSRPIPRSLCLLFEPFVRYMRSTLVELQINSIRKGSLLRLKEVADAESEQIEAFVRESSELILEVFVEVDQALSRAFAFVPTSFLNAAISQIVTLVDEVAILITDKLTKIADRTGIPSTAFNDYSLLPLSQSSGGFGKQKTVASAESGTLFNGVIYQPLASEEKLDAVTDIVGVSILSRLFSQCTTALSNSIIKQWGEQAELLSHRYSTTNSGISTEKDESISLLLGALMESCATAAEMEEITARIGYIAEPSGVSAIVASLATLSRSTASALILAMSSPFCAPLLRIPELSVWHSNRESKSSMNILVPQFSCSPSEEAVEIGEKMHILLPELEQVEAMDIQSIRGIQLDTQLETLFAYVLTWLAKDRRATAIVDDKGGTEVGKNSNHSSFGEYDEQTLPIQHILSLVLDVILQNIARQVCKIEPPLSDTGHEQLAADVDYIASVVSSFTTLSCAEFEEIRQSLVRGSSNNTSATASGNVEPTITSNEQPTRTTESEDIAKIRDKMQALLN
ncbi:hypothetical protein BX070DRAFT_247881 [Coemansia spiralis]|nr:hypothetical protein BX070DRAFT_247881 [Coemansia spiralis]